MSDGGRPRVAAVELRVATASAVAAACGLGVVLCGFLPWYGLESTVRAGATVELTVSLWGDDRGDLALAVFLAAGIGLSALTVAIRLTARPTRAAWAICVGAAIAFLLALLVVIARAGDAPGLSSTRFGAILAAVLAGVATAAAASRRPAQPARVAIRRATRADIAPIVIIGFTPIELAVSRRPPSASPSPPASRAAT